MIRLKENIFYKYVEQVWPIIAVWLLFVSWHPFVFGFYHDDWAFFNSVITSSLIESVRGNPTRPLFEGTTYILKVLFLDNHVAYQSMLVLLHLLCAIGVYHVFMSVFHDEICSKKQSTHLGGIIAGSLWLVFPWSLGYTAWATMTVPLLGMLISIVAVVFATRQPLNMKNIFISISLFCISWLIYEVTWFFWIPISLILIIRNIDNKKKLKLSMRYFYLGLLFQMLFVVFNRFVSAQLHTGKQLSNNVFGILESNLYIIKEQFIPMGSYLIVIGIFLLLISFYMNFKQKQFDKKIILILISFIVGICLSIILFAFAGYAIQLYGLFARTTFAISFWLSLLLSGLFIIGWTSTRKSSKLFAILGMLLLVFSFLKVFLSQSLLWKKSWDEQRAIIRVLPQPLFSSLRKGSFVLMDIPRGTDPVNTFSAYWDINAAILPFIKTDVIIDNQKHEFATVMRKGEWITTWDGENVKQFWCHSPNTPLWSLKAKEVHVWHYSDGSIELLKSPYNSGCIDNKE